MFLSANFSLSKRFFRKISVIVLVVLFGISLIIPVITIPTTSAAAWSGDGQTHPYLTPKWRGFVAGGGEALLTADVLSNYGGEEVFHAGGPVQPSTTPGRVTCLNGRTGDEIWRRSIIGIGDTATIQMGDIDGDGKLEIIVTLQHPAGVYVLNAEDGSILWRAPGTYNGNPGYITPIGGRIDGSGVIGDVDGDGNMDFFIGVMAYEKQPQTGKLIRYEWDPAQQTVVERARTTVWHPCAGGLSLGDTDNDGTFELYMNERDVYFGDGAWGRGLTSFWAVNLSKRWDVYHWGASSNIPMLADVNKDGVVDVVSTNLGTGVCVLNSTDGRPLTNDKGTVLSNAQLGLPVHYQSSIYDIDNDGYLELLCADGQEGGYTEVRIWDLYNWRLDGIIPDVVCFRGPSIGEVTGDGAMDIVVVTFNKTNPSNPGSVRIYNSNLNLLDSHGQLQHRAIGSVVQDIDRNDNGLNELLVLTQGGIIYCFDTPGLSQERLGNQRPRSEIHFYSESRNGASEYIPYERPWPDVGSPNIAAGAVNVSTSLNQLSFRLSHPSGQTMSYIVTTTPNIGSGSGTNVGNGVRSISVSGLTTGTLYRWQVNATDSAGHKTSQNYWFYTAPYYTNTPPTQGNPPISGGSTQQNLISQNQTTADINGDKVTNVYNWYKNGASITNLNLPFESKPDKDAVYSGTATTRDYSGRGNNGTVFGATYTQGVVGGGYYFDGNDFITVEEQSNSLGGSGTWTQMSVEFWIKAPTAGSTERLIWKPDRYDTRNINSYRVDVRNNNLQQLEFTWYLYSGTKTYSLSYNLTSGVTDWHHVVCTYRSGAGLRIYVDGTQRSVNSSSAISGNVNATVGPLQIAFNRPGGSGDFVGFLDEVRIYQYELSSAMINQRYLDTRNGLSSSSTIPSSDLTVGDQWRCQVTPNDGLADGTTLNTNTVTIQQGQTQQYSLTMNVVGNGTTDPAVGTYQYNSGTVVSLTAIPTSGYVFSGWSGAVTGTTNPTTVIMDANKTVTATFTPSSGHLFADDFESGTLSAWAGQESTATVVTTNPHGGIYHLRGSLTSGANNGWSGAYTNVSGANPVTLNAWVYFNAPPDTDDEDQWALCFSQSTAGNALAYAGIRQSSGTNYWAIWYLSAGTTLTYQLSSTPYTSGWHYVQLSINRGTANDGWVELWVDGALVCSAYNLDNDGRTLSYARVGFSYSDAPSAASSTVFIDDVTIDSSSIPPPTQYSLTVNVVGSGSVTKNPDQSTYTSGVPVELTAVPAAGWSFSGWSVDLTGTTNPSTITMDSNKTVTATFTQNPEFTLTVNTVGNGSVSKNPNQTTYTSGTPVELTANPTDGYTFTGWSGDLTGSINPATIIMDSDKTVNATFAPTSVNLLEDDFETGNLSLWDGQDGTTSVASTNPYQGTYHLSCSLASGANNGWSGVYKNITGTNPIHIKANIYIANPPDTNDEDQWVLAFTQNTAANALAYAGIRQVDGTLYWAIWYYSGTGLVYQVSSTPYSAGWHNLELALNRGTANDGWVQLYVDGVLTCSASNLDNDGRTLNYARVGFSYSDAASAATSTVHIDNVTIDT
jgi:uncharacterized repeat protein (TIGR02543 family)